jgi:hypothetical protein
MTNINTIKLDYLVIFITTYKDRLRDDFKMLKYYNSYVMNIAKCYEFNTKTLKRDI